MRSSCTRRVTPPGSQCRRGGHSAEGPAPPGDGRLSSRVSPSRPQALACGHERRGRSAMAGRWGAVTVLGAAQFVMVLDSTVMNVSISTVVADLHTTIAAMQTAITFYTLTMAAFMLLGAKLGDVWGRKRALVIGSIVYAIGSLTTALSPNIVVLFLGWSVVEGLGAVLVVPAIAALIADNYQGRARVTAFAVIGASSGAAVAAGPPLGGLLPPHPTRRLLFRGGGVLH